MFDDLLLKVFAFGVLLQVLGGLFICLRRLLWYMCCVVDLAFFLFLPNNCFILFWCLLCSILVLSCFWLEFLEGDYFQQQDQKLLRLGLRLLVQLELLIIPLRSSLRLIETRRRTNLSSTVHNLKPCFAFIWTSVYVCVLLHLRRTVSWDNCIDFSLFIHLCYFLKIFVIYFLIYVLNLLTVRLYCYCFSMFWNVNEMKSGQA